MQKYERQHVHNVQKGLKESGLLEPSENVLGWCEQVSFADTMGDLDAIMESRLHFGNELVKVCFMEMYEVIEDFQEPMFQAKPWSRSPC